MPADPSVDPALPDLTRGIYRRLYSGALTGRRINAVSEFSELLLWRIHMIADDFGRFKADAEILKSQAFPLRKTATVPKVRKGRDTLQEARLIDLYVVNGEPYGVVIDFESMQPAGRSGRRIPRNPPPPKSSDTNGLESGGIRGDPGGSGGHHHQDQDHDHNQNENDARPGRTARSQAAQVLREIYLAYPLKREPRKAQAAIREALKRLPLELADTHREPGGRKLRTERGQTLHAWLLSRTQEWAEYEKRAKGLRASGGFIAACPYPAKWFKASRYLEDWALPGAPPETPDEGTTRDDGKVFVLGQWRSQEQAETLRGTRGKK